FDSELTLALEEAENERELKDKVTQENTALGGQIYMLRNNLQESQAEVVRLQQQKEELCCQVRDLSVPLNLAADSLRQMEMQLEQEYEEKQMMLLSTVDGPAPGQPCSREHLERLHCQLEESEARRSELEGFQKTLSQELDNAQIELEHLCKHKSLVDEQLVLLQHEKADLLKRLEEDQEDLNELMKKHKALIAQELDNAQIELEHLCKHKSLSSSDISQIRELQAELEEVKKQRQTLQEELQCSLSRVQFLESSTVGRSIVSKQEARVCDLENKLEFQRGQVKRFEVLVLRLRDSVVRLGEELEQSAQTEARERKSSLYYQQRLHDMRLEMDDLTQREQDSSRRRMELEMQVEELTAVRQTLQADLETSIRRIVDLQAALEEVESSDESDTESDSLSSVGTEDVGEGIRNWLGVPRGSSRGGSPYGSQAGRQSITDTMSTLSFRSCVDDEGSEAGGGGTSGSVNLGRASSSSALSELLDGLRKRRGGGAAGSVSGVDPADGAGS
ncbi:hypothetical protein CRUP_026110, partial [Coryphaenoides rupestris]